MRKRYQRVLMLAVALVFLLCGCNGTDTVYEIKDGSQAAADQSRETVVPDGVASLSSFEASSSGKETAGEAIRSSETPGREEEPSEAAKEPQMIQIYVCGAVAEPGVFALEAGSRVFQAIEAAGGLLAEADERALNQARELADGEQITVWTREEASGLGLGEPTLEPGKASGEIPDAHTGKINLNTASKEELMTLSGIGESRAEAIIAYREGNGSFGSIEEIMNIEGIKEKMFEKIRGSIEV